MSLCHIKLTLHPSSYTTELYAKDKSNLKVIGDVICKHDETRYPCRPHLNSGYVLRKLCILHQTSRLLDIKGVERK